MCQICQKVHRRGAATKQHKLLLGDDMPKEPVKAAEDKPVNENDTGRMHSHLTQGKQGDQSEQNECDPEEGKQSDQREGQQNDPTERKQCASTEGKQDAEGRQGGRRERKQGSSPKGKQVDLKESGSGRTGTSCSMRAVYLEQLVVGSESDQYYTAVNALEVLEDGSLLVCDYGNYKVKHFDAEHELQCEVKLPAEPYGMAMLGPIDFKSSGDAVEALITIPSESCLQKIRVKSRRVKSGSKISLEEKLVTTLKCEKIMAFQGNFIVTAYDDMYFCLSLIGKTGKVMRSIYDEPRKSLDIFKSYYEMAVSHDKNIVFITNKKSGCVGISMMDGSVLSKYKEPGEANHYGISADPSGVVYVACCDTDKVVAIGEKTSEKVQDVVNLKDLKPSFVVYKEFGRKLFIGQAKTNKILCYQIRT